MGNCCESWWSRLRDGDGAGGGVEMEGPRSALSRSGLDAKCAGKGVRLGKSGYVATGSGVVLGKESLQQDKVYFEVCVSVRPAKAAARKGSVAGSSSAGKVHGSEDGEGEDARPHLAEVAGCTAEVGVAVRSSISSKQHLNRCQPGLGDVDNSSRWLYTWGPSEMEAGKEYVIGCAYDQSIGTGIVQFYLDGKHVAGPVPSGLRGIKGTCFPAIQLIAPRREEEGDKSSALRLTARTNFAVDDEDFKYAPPEGYAGLIPARGIL